MSDAEIECLKTWSSKSIHVFEWGAGGSTLFFETVPNLVSIHSIESDKTFAESLPVSRALVQHVDIGPTKEWGYPIQNTGTWCSYPQAFDSRRVCPDLVLIDGRFRVACGMAVWLSDCDPVVLIHDFSIRKHAYGILLDFFDIVEETETLAVLRKKEGDRIVAQQVFSNACKDPS